EPGVNERAFYYSRIYVDPTNENRVYRVSGDLSRSDDGGRTFEVIAPWSSVHVDHHAFYASPDGHTIVSGNDGGVFVSNDRGGSWRFVENLPLAQFYHLSVDMETPFNVLGGLQDNGSWRGPSQAWEQPSFAGSNITNEHWRTIGFGDGFAALIDPTDPTLGYSMSQGGNLQRFDLVTGQWAGIRPPAPDADTELRFNWNAGIALDPFDPSTIYYGSQFVHMSPDRGEDWEIISPDLTTDDPGKQRQEESGGLTLDVTAAENHTSILTIAPSSLERGVIWVGTDDGNVQITRDGGASWTNVIENVPGVPANTWIPHIEASKHDPATAYVVFDDHRRGNWETYVFRTTDYGESFQPLSPGQIDGYVHVIEEDPGEPNLLFLGTEFGMYVSLDRGANWRKFTHGDYPAGAPTRAIVVHPRDHDLAIGTHGRGAWIVDDIRPLREMAAEPTLADADLHLFSPPPAISHTVGLSGPFYFPGDTRFQGENRPYGALISYLVGDELADEFADEPGARPAPPVAGGGNPFGPQAAGGGEGPTTIEILQADTVVRTLKGPSMAGMNRIVWGLERKGLPDPDADAEDAEASGPEVLPGSYDVRITLGEATSEGSLTVLPDPRRERDTRIAAAAVELLFDGQARQQDLQRAIRRLNRTNEVLAAMETRLEDADLDPVVIDSLTAHTDRVQERSGALLDSLRTAPTGEIIADNSITARLGRALGEATGTPYMPSEGRRAQLEWAMEDAGRILREIDAFYTGQLEAYGEALEAAGFDPLDPGGS
ncbi:MAG TPA: hypothetical protein VJ925_08090, partial [Longimicrobiales bacterium]|nr:hypothetical protein [Longimicrobiales bacterium]